MKWSSKRDGFMEAWMNGRKVLVHRGPTLYHGISCYFKLANYHTPTGASSIIFDRVVRGTTARAVALARLRPGDVLTHAFRPFPNAPCNAQGTIKPEVRRGRERGVLFDIGHGMGSFAFKTGRAMLANGFLPDTISSDVHALCIDGPAFDLATTMSKFLCLGVELGEVIKAATENPAHALKRPELGTLKPGSPGEATILSLDEGEFDYVDVTGEHLAGRRKINARGAVIGGKWWHP
jgi:dihydroorotase